MRQILPYALGYSLWAINSALSLLGVVIARSVIDKAYIRLRLGPWAFAAVDKWSVLPLAVACLAFIMWCESYYRKGAREGGLWPRFVRVTIVEGFLVGGCYVAQLLM